MSLRVYNTLSGKKEEFKPIEPGKVRMYVCGVTVYDYCHIGHARANIVFDIIYRYLRYVGFDVTYVRNYTDVDDKIIKRANERGISSRELSEEFIRAFDEDMATLGLALPTYQPKATDYIAEIIALCEKLINRGLAYEAGGDVYYRVRKFPGYLKLSKRNMEEMQAGARIAPGEQKEDPMDFALWKAAKPGEPNWESPWGAGRPGWHIECSAMSSSLLGETFDIHGGGRDLIFPHHENEIAQSEGASGKPFVNYWLHNGFVNVDQEKMSKSLGNFFTIRDILKNYDPEVLRFFILTAHYRSPIDFSDQNLKEAKAGLSRFYEALKAADETLRSHPLPERPVCPEISDAEREVYDKIEHLDDFFAAAMDDDFNTAAAIGHLFEAVRGINRLIGEARFDECNLSLRVIEDGAKKLRELGGVLGLFGSDPAAWLERQKSAGLQGAGLSAEAIEELIEERRAARQNRDFARADQIRDALAAQGIELLDSKDGTSWKVK
ncbi:cysteine--tRNA ligase [Geothermobacter hydrogeniphilus]|uniref:Cysteine--tRNA ligase n=1 Tax=Geothermobacter hydrogeniphilus TaxID=1969733 RepID=A0A2K2H650_9BACT|nr:cysteine--tRNA ligase [Geothermobacter hydrogeniphilus]PNU18719.1 cysteine--tRNA ligase [Geothermobacter hydrogeniphilus]